VQRDNASASFAVLLIVVHDEQVNAVIRLTDEGHTANAAQNPGTNELPVLNRALEGNGDKERKH
jgi:hypothetical protein